MDGDLVQVGDHTTLNNPGVAAFAAFLAKPKRTMTMNLRAMTTMTLLAGLRRANRRYCSFQWGQVFTATQVAYTST